MRDNSGLPMSHDGFIWKAAPELLRETAITAFLQRYSLDEYDALLSRADADPRWLWDAVLRFFNVRFYRDYDDILDLGAGIEWPRWCVGGETNLVLNAIDRHRGTATWEKTAVVWEGEDGEGVWTQGDLAMRDADGLWYMNGRSDDTIKIAGKHTGPRRSNRCCSSPVSSAKRQPWDFRT